MKLISKIMFYLIILNVIVYSQSNENIDIINEKNSKNIEHLIEKNKIHVQYYSKGLEYNKKIIKNKEDDTIVNLANGLYSTSILYKVNTAATNIKNDNLSIIKESKVVIKENGSKEFEKIFNVPIDIHKYPNLELVYNNSEYKELNSDIVYNLILSKDNKLYKVILSKYGNKKIEYELISDLEIDISKEEDEEKGYLYLLKRELGVSFNEVWKLKNENNTSKLYNSYLHNITYYDKNNDFIQRRFEKKLKYSDFIEIYTKKDKEINNIIFSTNKNNDDLHIGYLKKIPHKEYNIYRFRLSKFMDQFYHSKKDIILKELQIFVKGKYHRGDIKKIKFLHSKMDQKKYIKKYDIVKITDSIYKHNVDLVEYSNYKLESIQIKILNKEPKKIELNDFNLNLYNTINKEIPTEFLKNFPLETNNLNYNQIIKISRDKEMHLSIVKKCVSEVKEKKLNLCLEKYLNYDVSSVLLKPKFVMEVKDHIIPKEGVIQSTNSFLKNLQIVLMFAIFIFVLRVILKIFFTKDTLVKILKPIKSKITYEIGFNKASLYFIFYLLLSAILFYQYNYSDAELVNTIYLSSFSITSGIMIFYFSMFIKKFIFSLSMSAGKVIYRDGGNIYYAWIIILLIIMVSLAILNLFEIVQDLAVVIFIFYFLGLIRDLYILKSNTYRGKIND
jgi:hypothetical protein